VYYFYKTFSITYCCNKLKIWKNFQLFWHRFSKIVLQIYYVGDLFQLATLVQEPPQLFLSILISWLYLMAQLEIAAVGYAPEKF
jgi:hypothetical protein